jgi:hypothetical protein
VAVPPQCGCAVLIPLWFKWYDKSTCASVLGAAACSNMLRTQHHHTMHGPSMLAVIARPLFNFWDTARGELSWDGPGVPREYPPGAPAPRGRPGDGGV